MGWRMLTLFRRLDREKSVCRRVGLGVGGCRGSQAEVYLEERRFGGGWRRFHFALRFWCCVAMSWGVCNGVLNCKCEVDVSLPLFFLVAARQRVLT